MPLRGKSSVERVWPGFGAVGCAQYLLVADYSCLYPAAPIGIALISWIRTPCAGLYCMLLVGAGVISSLVPIALSRSGLLANSFAF